MHKHFAVAYIEGLGGLRKSCLIPTRDKQSNATNWLNISTAANMPVILPLRNCETQTAVEKKILYVQLFLVTIQ